MKYTKKIIIIISILLIFITGCKKIEENIIEDDFAEEIENLEEEDNLVEETIDPIEKLIGSMTLEEKVGQLLIVGFEGTSINNDLEKYIHDYKLGGYILFSRNIANINQTIDLVNQIKELNIENTIFPFISIDEEGGRVSRLPKEFAKLPSAGQIGKKNNKEISYKYGSIIGERLKLLGLNMNFNPVLDINSNPRNPVIGDRAFGDNVETVVTNSKEVILGTLEQGIIPVAKHFPGHGDTSIDSHINLPIVEKDIKDLMDFELLPFSEAINNNIDGIMVGHILFPKIDKDYPATMSSKIMEDLLRKQLNFDGLIFSDDMTMGAIVENYSLEEAVLRFIKSGGDIALVCHGKDNPEIVINRIIKAIREGEIEEKEIDEKVYRILKVKEKFKLTENTNTDIDLEEINKEIKDLILELNK